MLGNLVGVVLRPQNGTWRDAVNANVGTQFYCQRPSEGSKAGFRHAIDRMSSKWAIGIDIDQVDNATLAFAKRWRGGLGQEEGCFEIGPDEVSPLLFSRCTNRRRIKRRGVVDQKIQSTEGFGSLINEAVKFGEIQQVASYSNTDSALFALSSSCSLRASVTDVR